MTGFFVGLNVCIVEKCLAVLDPRESITDVSFASADGFYFAAFQLDAGFVAIEDMKIAERLAIKDRLGGHGSRAKRALKLRGVRAFNRLECELTGDDFLEGDIGQRHTRGRFYHWPVS